MKKKRRLSPYDDFVYYDYRKNRIIFTRRDVAFSGVWEYYHFDGKEVWWAKGTRIQKSWVLLDRLPEGTLSQSNNLLNRFLF